MQAVIEKEKLTGTKARLTVERLAMPAANLGPENPLPVFRDRNENGSFLTDDSITDEEKRYLGWQVGNRVLPYRLQDGFDKDVQPRQFTAIVLENEFLRAVFLPEIGGRMQSLFDKTRNCELLACPHTFQPRNLALRQAWLSVGVEWNASQSGHSYLTCSPVFAAQVDGPNGDPVLRIYEWDRVKCFPWQVDFVLPSDSRFLFARVRIVNPHDFEIPMYWWTNIGVGQTNGARILTPADSVICAGYDLVLRGRELPVIDDLQVTYPSRINRAWELYFRLNESKRPWIAAVMRDGHGLVQTSTPRLMGRKMFTWGTRRGGRRWSEYLSYDPDRTFIEMQAGLTRTQHESIPMPSRRQWTWTEAFGTIQADPRVVDSDDWQAAVGAVESALDSALPVSALGDYDNMFAPVTSRPPRKIISRGSGWGALERRRVAKLGGEDRLPAELVFDDESLQDDQHQWLELLETGVLPEVSPQCEPGHFMVQKEWRDLLEQSIDSGKGDHWLSHYHVGNMRYEAFDAAGAVDAWQRSLELMPTSWAMRNLAVVELHEGQPRRACNLLLRAWDIGPRVTSLAVECARVLVDIGDDAAALRFIDSLQNEIRFHDRILLAEAASSIRTDRFDRALEIILEHDFVNIKEAEWILTDLWFELHQRRLASEMGCEVDDAIRERVVREFPPPPEIDFRTKWIGDYR